MRHLALTADHVARAKRLIPQTATQTTLLISATRFSLWLFRSTVVTLAKSIAALSGIIGSSARMAYVDPYMPNKKGRN